MTNFLSFFFAANRQNCLFLHHKKNANMINFNFQSRLSWRAIALRTAFVVVTVAAIVSLMPRQTRLNYNIEKNKPWPYADVTAAFDFFVLKSEDSLRRERYNIINEFTPRYKFIEGIGEQQVRLFQQRYRDSLPRFGRGDYRIIISNQLLGLYDQGIIANRDLSVLNRDSLKDFILDIRNHLKSKTAREVLTPAEAYRKLCQGPYLRSHQEALADLYMNEFIVPNIVYDTAYNQREIDDQLNNIQEWESKVQRGEKIITTGDLVDSHKYQVLTSYLAESKHQFNSNEERNAIIGETLFVLILVIGFTCYLGIYRNDYFERIRSACMLYAFIIIFSAIAALMVRNAILHIYILPVAIVPIFIRVFMDSRTAFMAHVVVVLIIASMLHHPMEFIAVQVTAGFTVIFSLRELSSRSQLFWTAGLWTAVAIATHIAVYLIRNQETNALNVNHIYYLIFCGIIIFCSYPLLYVIEKTFGFVSDISLVELSNTNKELLRRLSEEAPGTFNHSVQVGNLGAEVARKLGANAQLVRTGALYHDIGKMSNPIYFTENQSGGISPHEHLSYIESAQIIIGHVTEGLHMADKDHLPRQIRDLIATHHGQGKAKYFYIKYKNEHPDEPVDDLLFTYPGPNPFTKEQAILMMADAVEAASRSLPDYTEQTIRTLVERIIDSMVADGFFRECPITFRDIQYSKTVLIEKLKTIYHTRISYPEAKN